jgi:hypothetical protein
MAGWQRRLVGMWLPCLLAYLFDIGLTLHGQPAEYWAGDYTRTTEGAPFVRKLFELHPVAAMAGEAVWAGIILALVLLLPEVLAVIFAIAVVFGHAAGGYTWLGIVPARAWFITADGVFVAAAALLGVGLYWSLCGPATTPLLRRQPLVRGGLIAGAVALACYMYLVPQ